MRIKGAGQGTKRLVMLALILVAMLVAERVFPGGAYVTDGDTIEMDGERIRLWGIDAPELAQSCEREEGQLYLWQDGQAGPGGADRVRKGAVRTEGPRPVQAYGGRVQSQRPGAWGGNGGKGLGRGLCSL